MTTRRASRILSAARRIGAPLCVCLALAAPAAARVNLLEPWSPAVDFSVPSRPWTHGANLRLGAGDLDAVEASYNLSHSPRPGWEVEGTLGYLSIDGKPPFGDDSGLGDLAVAGKYAFSPAGGPASVQFVTEAGVSFPTGDADEGLGAGGLGFLLGWGLRLPIERVVGYAHLGLKAYTEGSDTHWGDVFSFTLGAQQPLRADTVLSVDLRGFNRGKDKVNGVRTASGTQELYLAPGIVWTPAGRTADVFGTILLGLSSDAHDLGLLAGVKF
jgi:hypothetical protein